MSTKLVESTAESALSACPSFVAAMDIVGRRWNGIILQALAKGCTAFSEIGRFTPGLSDAMLSRRLRDLEAQQLLTRTVSGERPPAVRYALTEAGIALAPILDALTAWGETYTPRDADGGVDASGSSHVIAVADDIVDERKVSA